MTNQIKNPQTCGVAVRKLFTFFSVLLFLLTFGQLGEVASQCKKQNVSVVYLLDETVDPSAISEQMTWFEVDECPDPEFDDDEVMHESPVFETLIDSTNIVDLQQFYAPEPMLGILVPPLEPVA